MNWIQGLLFLIPIAVFVLAHLARNREEPRRPARREAPPAGEPGDRPRRTSAEIDEFLREVRRRRDGNERKPRKTPDREPEPLRARPVMSVPAPPPPAPPPPPVPVATLRPRREEVLTAI